MATVTSAKRPLHSNFESPKTSTCVEVREYDRLSDKASWDAFVDGSMNGTCFHLQQFLAYHPEGKFNFHHLMFYDSGRLVAVLPGGLTHGGKHFESPMGASYGSFVTDDINAETALAIVWAFEDYVEKLGIEEVYLTSAPVVYQPLLSQNLEFALLYSGYRYQRHYISHVATLPTIGKASDQFDAVVKRYIRRAKSHYPGVEISEVRSEEFEQAVTEFYPIMLENKAKHDTKPTHSLDDLIVLNRSLPGMMKLWLLRLEGELIAGFLIFLANKRVPLSFYPMMRYEFRDVRPIYLLSEIVLDWAQSQGYPFFDFGVSQDTSDANPMTPALSLIEFKEKFASRGILRSTLSKSYTK